MSQDNHPVGEARTNARVTPDNWDRAGGNHLLARDPAGRLLLFPGDNAGGFGEPRQIGSGWNGYI